MLVLRRGPFSGLIAVTRIDYKRPFVNECKGVLCGAVPQKALGFLTLSTIREFSQAVAARVLQKLCGYMATNPSVIC